MRRLRSERAPAGSRLAIATSLAPGLVLFVVFYLVAIGTLAATAFTDWSLRGATFVGVDNFAVLVGDDRFWMAVRNTGFFIVASLVIEIPMATMVALVLARAVHGWRIMRVLLFLPNMMSPAALGLVFLFVFNARFGLINGALRAIGLDGLARDWLYDVDTAIFAVAATRVFTFGLYVILILNEIHSLPPEIQEAAQLDGADGWKREWWITLPLVRPVVATCTLLSVLGSLAVFEGVYVMTRGGPADQTITLGVYSYLAYSRGDWGLANAVGLVMLVTGAVLILLIRRLGRMEHSDR
ncbi:carbohydrate ABC transporter permease [Phytohabitans kaempferiae]|uniref:Carbohydrate ABC transporter permease n=1 Tax=Phytohabitans kaempferiae TaxID=1620943 RepID=A0ABV6M1S3_9ACTN